MVEASACAATDCPTLPVAQGNIVNLQMLQDFTIANLFGEAIFRIHNGLSIGAMFNQKII